MVGGSSSMNAMMWVRGFAADYDEWGGLAGEQWNYAHVEEALPPHRERAIVHRAAAQPAHLHRRLADGCTGMRLLRRRAESGCAGRLLRNTSHAAKGRSVQHRGRIPLTRAGRNLTLVTEATAMKVVFETRGPRRCQPGLARRALPAVAAERGQTGGGQQCGRGAVSSGWQQRRSRLTACCHR